MRKVLALYSVLLVPAMAERQFKSQAEYEIYNQILKESSDPAKQLQDLEQWSAKFPASEFAAERLWFYASAYNGTHQPDKVMNTVAELMSKDMAATFPEPKQALTILYLAALNVQALSNPAQQQLETGKTAAGRLLELTVSFFSAGKKPESTSDAEWAKARSDLESVANGALAYVAMVPGNRALAANPNDPANCATAEGLFTKAVEDVPNSALVAYALAGAMRCQQKVQPVKVPRAIYHYARTAALDPEKGGLSDPKMRASVETYLRKVYTQYHGSADGLDQLKQIALASPLPPPDFKLKSAAEIESEKEAEWAQNNPQLALWSSVRKQLVEAGGEQFFETSMKGAAVPKLKGTLVAAKPACRPRELLVAVSDSKNAEVLLKLSTVLTGAPEIGTEIQWEGVPTAFAKEPFLLTMESAPTAVENLKITPCAPTVKRKR